MKRTRSDLIRVGLFVLVTGSILAASLLWIAGSRLLRPRDTYKVLFVESVSGLNAGSNVEYQGVVVGRVRDIRLTQDIPPKVAVIIDLEPGTPVRGDTQAALLGSFVTGIQFIQLQGGSEAAGALPPGGVIPGSVASLLDFRDRAARFVDLALTVMTRLEEHVFTESNAKKLSQTVSDLGSLADRLNSASAVLQAEGTREDLAGVVARVGKAADSVDGVFSDFYTRREGFYTDVTSTLSELDAAIVDFRAFIADARAGMGGAGSTAGGLVADLEQATQQLQETLDLIEADPSLLLRGRSIPEREFGR